MSAQSVKLEALLGYIVRRAELYQLFVASSARGTGVAAALMADADARLSQAGSAGSSASEAGSLIESQLLRPLPAACGRNEI
jgi:GNAT superfamily N-acetyltransferase